MVVLICSGCSEKQEHWEQKVASDMMRRLRIYESLNHDVPVTNMVVLFLGSNAPAYPWWLHDSLKRFGKNAGFTHSMVEKYVFAPKGMTSRWIDAEIRLITAHPFAGENGKLKRSLIVHTEKHYGPHYEYRTLSESRIQEALTEQGLKIPPPMKLPVDLRLPPRPDRYQLPLHLRIDAVFQRAISVFGGDPRYAWILRNVVISAMLGLFVCAAILARNRWRKNQNDHDN